MAASTFDALEASRKLQQAGIEQQHAEAIADQLRSAAGADLNQLATKADVAAVKSDVAAVKSDVTWLRWGLGVNIAITLATLAAVLSLAWTLIP